MVKRAGRIQRRGVQRIRVQVVVPEVLVAPKHHPKVVPFVLFDAQSRHVIGIAAVSEVAEGEVIEQQSVVIDRTHFQGEIEKPHARTQIFKGVVGVFIAVDLAGAIAEFNALVDVVSARIDSRRRFGVVLSARGGRAAEGRDKDDGSN